MYVIRFIEPYERWKIGDEVEPFAKVYYYHSTNEVYLVRIGPETYVVPLKKVELIEK